MVDGDGLAHASRAIYRGFLPGMAPKHALEAALLRCVYLPLDAAGLRTHTLAGFLTLSHLSAVGIFWLLAKRIFPVFLRDRLVQFWCALGVVFSYGLLSRAVTIEVYAPALLLDLALVAYCLHADFRNACSSAIAGSLFVLAIGFHVSNLVLGPFILVLIRWRTGRASAMNAVVIFVASFILALGALILLMLLGQGKRLWPPDLSAITPKPDPQPTGSFMGRLVRVLYGMSRTIAFLPDFVDLRWAHATVYVVLGMLVIHLVTRLARRGSPQQRALEPRFIAALALLFVPYLIVGFAYYPSDPERWLFLLPVIWLVLGRIWDLYQPIDGQVLTRSRSQRLLATLVMLLGLYNCVFGVLPEARANRNLEGMRHLIRYAAPADLVISPSGVTGPVLEFYLGRPPGFNNLKLDSLAMTSPHNPSRAQTELHDVIADALGRGQQVWVYDLIGEGHVKQQGFPWGHLPEGYGPETFLSVLDEFPVELVVPPSRVSVGLYRLGLPHGAASAHFPGIALSFGSQY
jgi:hypothetical protein